MKKSVVLIIEDEVEVLKMLSSILRRQNVEVVEALGGAQALAALENTTPDIILLDLAMPGVSGMDILNSIKEQSRFHDVSILIITARPEMARQVCEHHIVDKIFLKPVHPLTLIKALRDYL